MVQISLTIYFAESFWVGVVEERDGADLRVARHVFGAEPGPGEVLDFVLYDLLSLLDHSGSHEIEQASASRSVNPKRAAREAARASAERGISTQAQEAMRLELECRKVERKQETKQDRDTEAARRRALAVMRQKERHRGH
ncbi:MAG: YjdF family protein [Oscillochloris sp.]|nr:YjdF family protein [Oscillochloris sp.]